MQDVLAVTVLVLHSGPQQNASIAEAIEYLRAYEHHSPTTGPEVNFEIEVRYKNGTVIRGTYQNKHDAIRDLRHWTE